MNRSIRRIIIIVLALLCFICLLTTLVSIWKLALSYKPFLRLVNGFSAYTRARAEILFLKSYDTFLKAKSAVESDPDTLLLVQTDSFGIAPMADGGESYIVKEKDGWKIENTFQFCRGHCNGITNGKDYLFIARLVQDQWYICIIFRDDQPHVCYSDKEEYIPSTYGYRGSGEIHQLVAISTRADEKVFSIYVDEDSYEFQGHEWVSSLTQGD